jgi:hypothetical protein
LHRRQLPAEANILPMAPKPPRLVVAAGTEPPVAGAAAALPDEPKYEPE